MPSASPEADMDETLGVNLRGASGTNLPGDGGYTAHWRLPLAARPDSRPAPVDFGRIQAYSG